MPQFSHRDIDTMNNIPPRQTSDTHNPQNRSTNSPPEDQGQRRGNPGQRPRLANQSRSESTEEVWGKLEELQRKTQQRKNIEEAAKKSSPVPTSSSEPSLRSHQRQASDRRDRSSSSTDNGFNQHDEKHNEQRGGVAPDFFENLEKQKREEIAVVGINQAGPVPILTPGPCVSGKWTALHLLAAIGALPISDLITMGASLEAVNQDGLTLLHTAVFRGNRESVRQLLAAGANPLACNSKVPSPIACALEVKQEFALELAKALPDGSKANVYKDGDNEVKMAVKVPDVLYVMLSKGMTDSADTNGKTALMHAAELGELQSVKYLLGQRPQNEKKSDFLDYIDRTDDRYGVTALSIACKKNNVEIVDLLIRHGASLYQSSDQPSLLEFAAKHRNTSLLKLLLENGAAEYEADLTGLLFKFVNRGQSEAVQALGPYVSLTRLQQYQLLHRWKKNPQPELLAAISPLIAAPEPSVRSMIGHLQVFLTVPLTKDSPQLFVAVLEFFDRRVSLNYVLQSYISIFLDNQGATIDPAMGKILLDFALPRFSRLSTDRETVMRLLQLSEKLKDYSLITKIKEINFSDKSDGTKKIPLDTAWITDPVSLEFLDVTQEQDSSRFSNFLKTVSSFVSPSDDTASIDGAQLSNDLIFVLKSDAVDDALDKVFKSHQLAAIVQQALKPMLQGLITQLYPDPTTRRDAVCRFLIGYAFSTLKDNPRFSQHPALELMQSNAQWERMKRNVNAQIEVLDEVAVTILDTMASVQLWETLPAQAIRHTLDSLSEKNPEKYLINAFRSLGALDVPARRLAMACISAARRWKDQGESIPGSGKLPQGTQLQLKSMITNELEALRKRASLPEQLASNALNMDADLNIEFHEMLWWQWDLVHRAFGIVTSENTDSDSDGQRFSEVSSEGTESEKS
jgi:ankyrin repeat protein